MGVSSVFKRGFVLFAMLFCGLQGANAAVELNRYSWTGGREYIKATQHLVLNVNTVAPNDFDVSTITAKDGLFAGLGPGNPPVATVASSFIPDEWVDWIVGIHADQPALVDFSNPMYTGSFSNIKVYAVRNSMGQDMKDEVLVSTSYVSNQLGLMLSSGSWNHNIAYKVEVSTDVIDDEGEPLEEPLEFTFQTVMAPTQDNIIRFPSGDNSIVQITSGTLAEQGRVMISSGPFPALVDTATTKFERMGYGAKIYTTRHFSFYNNSNEKINVALAPGDARVYLPYSHVGMSSLGNVSLYALDESAALWVKVPNSQLSTSSSAVYAAVPKFTYYAVGTMSADPMDEVFAYPSPYRPHGPNAGTGPGQTGSEAGGITFANMPSGADVEVYTVRGELVWKGREAGAGKVVWDVKNSDGRNVASGVYVYLIKSSVGRKTGKFAVIL